ncbi:hypothetical protein G4G27_11880 [Sphingomonas sp. So64.6b]|uniref:hypothetical protein n=1 Tax=Sphingomonas sp. So64.6b TaxID=2997354 RepID=UPI00160443E8|nr:hypothetical protein [Sphingomonas sp. So64.6b]QNA84605.1 hypothetical protein G4G27_11880 [Sphingomonas sp. So64.6b]
MIGRLALCIAFSTPLTGCINPSMPKPSDGKAVANGEKQVFETIDALSRQQAQDVVFRMGWIDDGNKPYDDYDVKVYYGGPVLGSLIEGQLGNLINSTACKPAAVEETAINAFSSYEVTGQLALQLGLPIPNFPLGMKAGRELTSSYSLEGAHLKLLTRDELDNVLANPACQKRVAQAKGRVWIVRGLITAKRSYSFYTKNSASLTLSIPNSNNSLSNDSSVKGAGQDSEARVYFMVLKPVRLETQTSLVDTNPLNICMGYSGNKIYLQRDAADATTAGVNVRDALDSKFNVVRQIQAIDHDRMPSISQVRYFSAADKAAAECAVSVLKSNGHKNSRAVMLNLASPPKQLEIWLTKIN